MKSKQACAPPQLNTKFKRQWSFNAKVDRGIFLHSSIHKGLDQNNNIIPTYYFSIKLTSNNLS